jgi:signal transduction histidine kinase
MISAFKLPPFKLPSFKLPRRPQHRPNISPAQILLWIGGLLLVLALTGFFFKSQSINPAQHYRFIHDIRLLKDLASDTNADMLRARFAIDTNYSRLVRHSEQLRLRQLKLRNELPLMINTDRAALQEQFRQIEVTLSRQSVLVERFKSQNTILQNSLRYFPWLAQTTLKTFAAQGINPAVQNQLQALLESMLIDNINTRSPLKPQIQQQISQIATLSAAQPTTVRTAIEAVLMHAQVIVQLKGDVQQIINEATRLPIAQPLERFINSYEGIQTRVMREAGIYRGCLYAACLGLLGFVIRLYRIRYRARLLTIANTNLEKVVDERTQNLTKTLNDLQESQVQLIQAEKMAGLGQLVAGIAHEINNPISFIYSNITPTTRYVNDLMGIIERYQTIYPDPVPAIDDYLSEIDWEFTKTDLPQTLTSMRTGADRIREIVLSLRNFSRLDEADKKPANLNEGVISTLLILQHRLKAQTDRCAIPVIQDLGPLPKILCYPGQINQVLMNLIANAIDALEEALAQNPQLQPEIGIRTSVISEGSHSMIRVEVADNGIGMSPATQQKLFNPFFTTKPVGKGTGLGTSISYQIVVDRHGGRIHCESTLGQGSRFTLEFPIAAEETDRFLAKKPTAPQKNCATV